MFSTGSTISVRASLCSRTPIRCSSIRSGIPFTESIGHLIFNSIIYLRLRLCFFLGLRLFLLLFLFIRDSHTLLYILCDRFFGCFIRYLGLHRISNVLPAHFGLKSPARLIDCSQLNQNTACLIQNLRTGKSKIKQHKK